jgi:hypothetical protein
VKSDALRSIVATLGSVFPSVETWELALDKDLAFVASRSAMVHDVARTRMRVETEPYRSALALVWGVNGAEGLYTGVLGNADFAPSFRSTGASPVNTDDRTYLEFAFARSLGDTAGDALSGMRQLSGNRSNRQPHVVNGSLDWVKVDERRATRAIAEAGTVPQLFVPDPAVGARQSARILYARGDLANARRLWMTQSEEPSALGDVRMVAESFANVADPHALGYIETLRAMEPVEAEALTAVYANRTNNPAAAADHLIQALTIYRVHPWANRALIERAFDDVGGRLDRAASGRVFDTLQEPFAVRALDITRLEVRSAIGLQPGFEEFCVQALAPLEPNVPWEEVLLRGRDECYSRNMNPLAATARADLERFLKNAQSTPKLALQYPSGGCSSVLRVSDRNYSVDDHVFHSCSEQHWLLVRGSIRK